MNLRILVFAVCAAILLTACGGKKQRTSSSSQLIEQTERLGIDTVEMTPGDTLCNSTVDEVLRHYPELYKATEKAQQTYDTWVTLCESSHLCMKPALLDIPTILDETLFGTQDTDADSAWQHLATIDSLYIQALVSIPTNLPDTEQRMSAIGRTRKAWQALVLQLRHMESAVPDDCRQRYLSVIKDKTRLLADPNLYKLK